MPNNELFNTPIAQSIQVQIHLLQNLMNRFANKWLQEHDIGLKVEQVPVIMSLWKTGPTNQQNIADRLDRDKSSIYRSVQSLVQKELLITEEDPNNKRNKIIYLTDKGQQTANAVEEVVQVLEQKFKEKIQIENYNKLLEHLKSCNKIFNELYNEIQSQNK